MPFSGCVTIPDSETEPFYTTHNIWVYYPFAINYKVGEMIPAGTRAYNIRIAGGDIRYNMESLKNRFILHANRDWQPGLSVKELLNRTFSHNSFDELTNGMTEREIDAIRAGIVFIGMSRRAVEMSYGFPPLHQTPFYDENRRWRYWLNKYNTQLILFDHDWKVMQIID